MIYAAFKNFLVIRRKVWQYFSIICLDTLPGADPGQVGLGTPDAPADDPGQEPAVVLLAVDHQGPSGVALEGRTTLGYL